jgi:hypothetical protein
MLRKKGREGGPVLDDMESSGWASSPMLSSGPGSSSPHPKKWATPSGAIALPDVFPLQGPSHHWHLSGKASSPSRHSPLHVFCTFGLFAPLPLGSRWWVHGGGWTPVRQVTAQVQEGHRVVGARVWGPGPGPSPPWSPWSVTAALTLVTASPTPIIPTRAAAVPGFTLAFR